MVIDMKTLLQDKTPEQQVITLKSAVTRLETQLFQNKIAQRQVAEAIDTENRFKEKVEEEVVKRTAMAMKEVYEEYIKLVEKFTEKKGGINDNSI